MWDNYVNKKNDLNASCPDTSGSSETSVTTYQTAVSHYKNIDVCDSKRMITKSHNNQLRYLSVKSKSKWVSRVSAYVILPVTFQLAHINLTRRGSWIPNLLYHPHCVVWALCTVCLSVWTMLTRHVSGTRDALLVQGSCSVWRASSIPLCLICKGDALNGEGTLREKAIHIIQCCLFSNWTR